MLPDINGYDIARRLKSRGDSFTPVILVTALGETHDKVAGLDAGADPSITHRHRRAASYANVAPNRVEPQLADLASVPSRP